jgi:hypothetical protein
MREILSFDCQLMPKLQQTRNVNHPHGSADIAHAHWKDCLSAVSQLKEDLAFPEV